VPADRRRLLLGGAGVAVLVLAIWVLRPESPTSAAAPQAAASTRAARAASRAQAAASDPAVAPVPVAPVKLNELARKSEEPGTAQRNPFRYQPKVAPPPPRPVTPPPSEIQKPAPPPPPPGPPPLPPIPLKFIGVVERANGVKWAVLSDGKVTLHGKDGDNIDGRYRIVKIGVESIEMTYLDGRGRQVIRLTGQ
jgi:hypothetical protein